MPRLNYAKNKIMRRLDYAVMEMEQYRDMWGINDQNK